MKKLFTLLLLAFMAVGVYAQEKVFFLGSHTLDWDHPTYSFSFSANDIIRIEGSLVGDNNQVSIQDGSSTLIKSLVPKEKMAYILSSDNASTLTTNQFKLYGTGYTYNKVSKITVSSIKADDATLPVVTGEEATKLFLNWQAIANASAGDVLSIVFDTKEDDKGWAQLLVEYKKAEDSWNSHTIVDRVNVYEQSVYDITLTQEIIDYLKSSSNAEFSITGKNVKILQAYIAPEVNYILSPSNNYVDVASLPNTAINVELARQFWYGWNSLCLPFNAEVSTIAADAELYEFTSATSESVTLTKKNSGEIVAGTPYLVKLSSNSSETTAFTNVSVTASTAGSTSTYGGLTFKGNYEAGFDMTDKYGVVYTDNWYIMKGGTNATGKAFSAYFDGTVPTKGQTRGFSIITDDGTTKINTVEKVEEGDGEIYNLMGVRTSAPRKGIYIKNGKKYIVK